MDDFLESSSEAMSCAQIEYDKLCLLYAICSESDTAVQHMRTLCSAMDVPYSELLHFSPANLANQALPF